jgi:hypothetical protein
MGASGWQYRTKFTGDASASLHALRQRVFDDHDYYLYQEDEAAGPQWPATMAELFADEDVQESGTHSILDVDTVTGPGEQDDFGTVRLLSPREVRAAFGTDQPTIAQFDALASTHALPDQAPRWSGVAALLYTDGQPTEIAFWGCSGD